MDLKDIKGIVDLMKKNSISEFELEKQDFKIKLKRGPTFPSQAYEDQPTVHYLPAHIPGGGDIGLQRQGNASPDAAPKKEGSDGVEIPSPMIGTFYRSPSPESPSYVELGSEVEPETVVCIIEAMKVMNEIKAEAKGVITEILVDNAKPVEFGQPLFKIRPT